MAVFLVVRLRGGAISGHPGATAGATDGPSFYGVGAVVGFSIGLSIRSKTALSTGLSTPPRHWPVRALASSIALALAFVLPACSHPPKEATARAEYELNNDPAEPTNRTIFAGNKFVDDHALQPVARGYEDHVPSRARKSIHNFVSNLGQPAVAINDVLQGNFSRSWNTLQRFVINTTVGGAGLFDVATDWNRPAHLADFGQTLGVWGVAPGPSVQLPLFGPSNVRDSVGKVVDLVTNPANFLPGGAAATVSTASGAAGFVDGRAGLLSTTEPLERTSLDYYAATRSVAAQRRAALVAEGKVGAVHNGGEPSGALPPGAPPPGAPQ
jgi:phospholipid-binding lipoprotein MlaA